MSIFSGGEGVEILMLDLVYCDCKCCKYICGSVTIPTKCSPRKHKAELPFSMGIWNRVEFSVFWCLDNSVLDTSWSNSASDLR